MQEVRFNISSKALFKILGFAIFVYVLYLIWNILLLLFISLLLAALIDPFASWFQKRKIPRVLAVIIIYIILLGLLALVVTLLTPVVKNDVPQLTENLVSFVHDLQNNTTVQMVWNSVTNLPGTLGFSSGEGNAIATQQPSVVPAISGVFTTLTGFFGGLVSFILVLVMTFYMVSQEDPLKKILRSVVPDKYVPYLTQLFKKIRDKLGSWMRGQLLLSLIMGTLVFVGLTVFDVRYAAVFGLLAAITEFVPYLGPVLSGIPALLIAFIDGGVVKFVIILAMFVVIHQFENHILVPKVMQRAVGLNPIISITALLIGAQLGGIVGVLLAIPVATTLSVFLKDVFHKRE